MRAQPVPGRSDAPLGTLLRTWRARRGMSQLALSAVSGVSTRHLSCVETGKAQASRDLLHRLADALAVPSPVRDAFLAAAGYLPGQDATSRARTAGDAVTRAAAQALVDAHGDVPALVMEHDWTLVAANAAVLEILGDVADHLQTPPVNLLRTTLAPDGLAPLLLNLGEVRDRLRERVERQLAAGADPRLRLLLDELAPVSTARRTAGTDPHHVLIPITLRSREGTLNLISTTTTVGLPGEVSHTSFLLETFHPTDPATVEVLRRLVATTVAPRPATARVGSGPIRLGRDLGQVFAK